MNRTYPFDPSLKHHLLIAAGIAIWVFVLLYLTEPLDVNELTASEKLKYLPLYGLFASFCYACLLPLQQRLYSQAGQQWRLISEVSIILSLTLFAFIVTRLIYFYIVMDRHPNAYSIF